MGSTESKAQAEGLGVRLYNTRTHEIEPLETVEPGKVRLYVCGVSVSGVPHVGHGRSYVVFDVLRRVLEHAGYEVTHVQNFTDIEDAIRKRAEDAGKTISAYAEEMIQAYFDAMDRLAVRRAHHFPRVTDYIDEIVEITTQLEEHRCAYEIDDGMAFRTEHLADFGGLLGRDPAKAIVEPVPESEWSGRESPFDFILWRNDDQMGLKWETPWGQGRPGWHTECAVMATDLLGETIDIHGGGVDLIFPHHECERAIAQCLTGKRFARFWVHNGLVTMDKEKMSKSLENYVTLQRALDEHGAATVRMACLSAHYRETLEWSDALVDRARELVATLKHHLAEAAGGPPDAHVQERRARILSCLYNDLDLPGAVREVADLARHHHQEPGVREVLWESLDLLGLSELEPLASIERKGA